MHKLKYLKLFESEGKFDKVKREIESISYIMEDEKMKVDISFSYMPEMKPAKWEFSGTSKIQKCLVKVEHQNPLMGHGDYSWLRKYDWFSEWFDRIKEIASNNGFQVRESYNVFIIS